MNGHEHPAQHHPQTFDEVIARGFPRDQLGALEEAHEKLLQAEPVTLAPPLAPAAGVASRKNATTFSTAEQAAFKTAVQRLVSDGTYVSLVAQHMDMRHMMHGSMGTLGLYRFLAWHRRYLVEFERELQRVDAILRPNAAERLGVPYWPWQDAFPVWLNGFLPARDPVSGAPPQPRKLASPPPKANAGDLNVIVTQFRIQAPGLPGENDYTKFTYGLEGWGKRADGTSLPAHNHGHAWVGGIMNNTSTSPTDPVFWLHHAEVDRLWETWRQTNPSVAPPLSGASRVMDPWSESYDDLLAISALGYAYNPLTA